MAFGLSFGSKKQTGKSTTNVDKTDTTNETQSGTKASVGTTTTTGSSNTQSSQSGTQTGQTSSNTSSQQNTSSTTTQFSDSVLGGLESAVGQLLGAIPTDTQQLNSNFNKEQFIASGMDAASSQVQTDLEASLNSMFDQFGGRDDDNSMAMLLANRARSDAAASLAGTRANLTSTAEGIARENFNADLAGLGQNQNFLATVLSQLKGGTSTTTGTATGNEATTGTSAQQNQQTGSQNTQTAEQSTQALIEALSSILSGTTHTVGTETTKSKGKNTGFGAGLSL